jgi:tetratricopeptide (TPR) repeat protein
MFTKMGHYDEALETFFKALGFIEGSEAFIQDYSSPQFGRYYTREELNQQAADKLRRKRKELARVYREIAWTYKFQDNHNVAVKYIDEAVKFDFENPDYWNVKAIILEEMGLFDDSLECYNQALEFEYDDIFIENKARMLKRWAQKLYDDDKKLGKAENMIEEAIDIISSIESDEEMMEYVILRNDIRQKLKFKDQKGILKGIGRNNLVTITGTSYYGYPNFEKGAMLELVREPDNEHDSDAVAVYMDGCKVGYVANSPNTSCNMTTKASNLDIGDSAHAKYLMNYMYEFRIARIWRDRD